jgi:diaminopimelate epimerase
VTSTLTLTKHHGAGNDFVVLVDPGGQAPAGPAVARALCDRHCGIGADGFIRVLSGSDGADVTMDLRNADGSPAEMSGNGIRCLAQAAVLAGVVSPPSFTVATGAGVRTVGYEPGERPWLARASVDMGWPVLGTEEPGPVTGSRAVPVDMGNPHLVVLGLDPGAADLPALAAVASAQRPDGVNVEVVAVDGVDHLRMRVFERGVGETLACGTGTCAAAAVARSRGLVGASVVVTNPGGDLVVVLGEDGVRLAGPTAVVATVVVDLAALAGCEPDDDEP